MIYIVTHQNHKMSNSILYGVFNTYLTARLHVMEALETEQNIIANRNPPSNPNIVTDEYMVNHNTSYFRLLSEDHGALLESYAITPQEVITE